MKTRFRWYLAAGFILTGEFTGVGQSAAAGSPQTRSTITVHVYNYAKVDRETLVEAEGVAAGIFRKAGVETRWVVPALTPESEQKNAADQSTLDLTHIQLDILPPLMAEHLGLPNNVMGLAPGTERDRQLVYLFYDKVEVLAERQMRARVDGGISTYAIKVQILGHAIVHEIGHVLLNLESHSDTGIMRDDWGLRVLQDACYGYLVFTPPQAEAIRLEVGRRSRQQQTLEVN
jgi:hypothetical protein